MKLAHRFLYYFSGFTIGIIFLVFFLSGKETSCEYGPDARTLKSIRVLKHDYSKQAENFLAEHNLDTVSVNHILKTGDVDFGKSKTHLDSCNVYNVYGEFKTRNLELIIERCSSVATIKKINMLP
ncbi:MAG TPA: hypothetical protein VFM82_02560 [Flavobacteriaceae bacterium]|nr:hypothetical protein [Flavobacteriaceae bacterium]